MLNPKQRRFVAEYLKALNATQAAQRAGYSKKTAYSSGQRLLKHVEVAAAIAAGQRKRLDAAELSAVRVLEEMRRLAFSDVRGLFDAHGNLIPVHQLPDHVASTVASIEVVKKNLAAGDGQTDTVHKLKVWDKTKALEQLGKHFGLLAETLHVTVEADQIKTLLNGRHRAASRH